MHLERTSTERSHDEPPGIAARRPPARHHRIAHLMDARRGDAPCSRCLPHAIQWGAQRRCLPVGRNFHALMCTMRLTCCRAACSILFTVAARTARRATRAGVESGAVEAEPGTRSTQMGRTHDDSRRGSEKKSGPGVARRPEGHGRPRRVRGAVGDAQGVEGGPAVSARPSAILRATRAAGVAERKPTARRAEIQAACKLAMESAAHGLEVIAHGLLDRAGVAVDGWKVGVKS